jgi:uncharacterized membrane protein
VSYLFIAIVWANHHHLLRYATDATPRLMWFNFAHLFSASLGWQQVNWRRSRSPFYAVVFFFVNATYICLIRELIDRAPVDDVSQASAGSCVFRSIVTLCVFGAARSLL